MAKVTFRDKSGDPMSKIATSGALGDQLEKVGAKVLAAAKTDPNATYVASLKMQRFITWRARNKRGGSAARVSVQVGAAPIIGSRVEAKRGTLSRALGRAGL